MAATTARKSAIHELANQGQSLWLDNLRRPFITSVGALKDVVQNHLLQVVALLAMAPPVGVDAERLRDEKLKVFRAIPAIDPSQVLRASAPAGVLYRELGITPDAVAAAVRIRLPGRVG